jgi:hypothetical protein
MHHVLASPFPLPTCFHSSKHLTSWTYSIASIQIITSQLQRPGSTSSSSSKIQQLRLDLWTFIQSMSGILSNYYTSPLTRSPNAMQTPPMLCLPTPPLTQRFWGVCCRSFTLRWVDDSVGELSMISLFALDLSRRPKGWTVAIAFALLLCRLRLAWQVFCSRNADVFKLGIHGV